MVSLKSSINNKPSPIGEGYYLLHILFQRCFPSLISSLVLCAMSSIRLNYLQFIQTSKSLGSICIDSSTQTSSLGSTY